MKHLFFSVALVSTMLGFGQASGNLNYQNRGRNSLNNNDYSLDFPTNYEMVVSAKGLANIKADAFVAIFSVVQVGKSAEEATSLMSQRLSPVLSALKAKNMDSIMKLSTSEKTAKLSVIILSILRRKDVSTQRYLSITMDYCRLSMQLLKPINGHKRQCFMKMISL